jgi:hypothetical protein
MGLSIAMPEKRMAHFEHFLKPENHKPGTPLDYISYHSYAQVDGNQPFKAWPGKLFEGADQFLGTVDRIEEIRKKHSPSTKTSINELSTMIANAPHMKEYKDIPEKYWPLSTAVQAHSLIKLVERGIDSVAMSQLIGDPGMYPSITIVNPDTGKPTPRYWALKLMIQHIKPGSKWFPCTLGGDDPEKSITCMAIQDPTGKRKVMLVNHTESPLDVEVPCAKGTSQESVDVTSGSDGTSRKPVNSSRVKLEGFAVSILEAN